jgi:hypothetical protein
VVVDDVEHDLDPGGVQRVDHAAELRRHRVRPRVPGGARRIGRVRREEGERVVAPVVDPALRAQPLLARGGVHRQELDGRDPEVDEALHGGRVPEPRVRAADLLRQPLVELGEAAHVQLVEHLPVAGHDRPRGSAGGALVRRHVARDDRAPGGRADLHEAARVGIQQMARRVEGVAGRGVAVDAHRVRGAGHEPGAGSGPHAAVPALHRHDLGHASRVVDGGDGELHGGGAVAHEAQRAALVGERQPQGHGRSGARHAT